MIEADPYLTNLPKSHPREAITRDADLAINRFMMDDPAWRQLTMAETQSLLIGQLAQVNKFLLRRERHGDTSKPAGLE